VPRHAKRRNEAVGVRDKFIPVRTSGRVY